MAWLVFGGTTTASSPFSHHRNCYRNRDRNHISKLCLLLRCKQSKSPARYVAILIRKQEDSFREIVGDYRKPKKTWYWHSIGETSKHILFNKASLIPYGLGIMTSKYCKGLCAIDMFFPKVGSSNV